MSDKKVFVVTREIVTEHGTIRTPVKTFSHQEDANKFAQEVGQAMMNLLGCRLMRQVNESQAADAGLTVKELLANMGVTNLRHMIIAHEVSGADIVVPPRKIILSS